MIYKRDPRFRRYGTVAAQNIPYMQDNNLDPKNTVDLPSNTAKEVEKIPLPNEKDEPVFDRKPTQVRKSPLSMLFSRRLHSDEIILLFLIFILIEEGIDDDFLLIVLIYLLVSEIFEEYFRLPDKSV
ncbi:hypothetical protein [Acetivibrio mesophilus]|uniref:Uncharacterized protein n=1 Tax=Acetivibrio mesophilus TaxID=2487273 RepID=A0A4Q0I7B4_9FIRM|nr:hypothetical protein [Acetivibrio mesophilus]ODM26674.1 hypothetical protein A7W90_10855 [Clostridium sp. Bc-iso-3]RXE58892.1 hypothetical protein EFD62_09635 [Acetivibrio mesophilus]HHV28439.1 hypothetical protein [Clostridium sp.]